VTKVCNKWHQLIMNEWKKIKIKIKAKINISFFMKKYSKRDKKTMKKI
jgi:hypothetical protein